MLKKELKDNRKSLFIWLLVFVVLFALVYAIYPSIMNSNNSDMLNEAMKSFPPEVLKMFNMDMISIDTVFGWFKTEGYTFLILLGGVYSGMLGATILSKEETDKTIEFLSAKPVSRNKIVTAKILCGFINITFLFFAITLFNMIGMYLSNDLHLPMFLRLSLAPLLSSYTVFLFTMLMAELIKKTKKAYSLGIIIVFVFYILQMISILSDKISFLKYITPFTLADSRRIIMDEKIGIVSIALSIIILIVLMAILYPVYNKKDFD